MSVTLSLWALPELTGDSQGSWAPFLGCWAGWLGATSWSWLWLVLEDIPGACLNWPLWQTRFPLQALASSSTPPLPQH